MVGDSHEDILTVPVGGRRFKRRYTHVVAHALRLLTCHDPVVMKIAWIFVRRLVKRRIGNEQSENDREVSERISGVF